MADFDGAYPFLKAAHDRYLALFCCDFSTLFLDTEKVKGGFLSLNLLQE